MCAFDTLVFKCIIYCLLYPDTWRCACCVSDRECIYTATSRRQVIRVSPLIHQTEGNSCRLRIATMMQLCTESSFINQRHRHYISAIMANFLPEYAKS